MLDPRNGSPENVAVHAVVIAELELGNIERQVLAADLVEGADNAALEDRLEALNRIRVNCSDDVLARAVAHELVWIHVLEPPIAGVLVGGQQAHIVCNRLPDEGVEGVGIGALDHAGDGIPLPGHRPDDDELVAVLTTDATRLLVPMAVFALPVVTGCQRINVRVAVPGAANTFGPAAGDQIGNAGIFVRECCLKLKGWSSAELAWAAWHAWRSLTVRRKLPCMNLSVKSGIIALERVLERDQP